MTLHVVRCCRAKLVEDFSAKVDFSEIFWLIFLIKKKNSVGFRKKDRTPCLFKTQKKQGVGTEGSILIS